MNDKNVKYRISKFALLLIKRLNGKSANYEWYSIRYSGKTLSQSLSTVKLNNSNQIINTFTEKTRVNDVLYKILELDYGY